MTPLVTVCVSDAVAPLAEHLEGSGLAGAGHSGETRTDRPLTPAGALRLIGSKRSPRVSGWSPSSPPTSVLSSSRRRAPAATSGDRSQGASSMTVRRTSVAAVLFQVAFIMTIFVVHPRWVLGGRAGCVSPRRSPLVERVASAVLVTGCSTQLGAQMVAACRGRFGRTPTWLAVGGGALGIGATALAVTGQSAMGAAWSTTVSTASTAPLVTHGVFASMRNPIYTSIIAAAIGAAMMSPTRAASPSIAMIIAGLELQVRAVEEPVLEDVHGERYRTYCERTGRFVPRLTHNPRRPARRAHVGGINASG